MKMESIHKSGGLRRRWLINTAGVVFLLGLAAAACNMAGNYVGAGLAMTKGSRITRPVIILVLCLLFLKVLGII